jgi:hypothetical protein
MNYLKSLVINFLIVFFANHVIPGIEAEQTKIPHLGGDLIFAFLLGLLNSLIYLSFKLIRREASALKIGLIALILNFAAYGIVKLLPIGLVVTSVEGYIFASATVSLGSFLLNYFEMKHGVKKLDLPL